MYSVMLIDDEPLILSGIKSLLNWEDFDCQIVATARNGNEALKKIQQLHPQIVFCDINMPTISGIDLLETVSAEMPSVVFIMLTNLQDFDLVQSAIHYRALDYIVKTQLDSDTLLSCLQKAKKECANRKKLENAETIMFQNQILLDDFLKDIFSRPYTAPQENTSLKQFDNICFNSYCTARLLLTHSLSEETNYDDIFTWEKELIQAIAEKHFTAFHLITAEYASQGFTLICEELPKDIRDRHELFRQFYQTLCRSSQKITNISVSLLVTECFHGIENIWQCRKRTDQLLDIYYNMEQPLLLAESLPPVEFQPLKLIGISVHLKDAIHEKNTARYTSLIDRVIRRIQDVFHQRVQAIWLCNEIYTVSCDALMNTAANSLLDSEIFQTESALNHINEFHTRSQLTKWLAQFGNTVCALLNCLSQNRNQFIDLTKKYVEEHLEEHISLSDAADYVNLSPAYLSSLFRKSCNESFVNYVNRRKIDYACHLIQENKYLIYEIAYRLGFNNAYYFTKIFKRYMGITPVEYQNNLSGQNS